MSRVADHGVREVVVGRANIDCLTFAETVDVLSTLIETPGVHQQAVVNAGKVVAAQTDDDLLASLDACDVVNADGMSVVWASRLLGTPLPERVTGIDLMYALLQRAAQRGWGVYLLGARPEVVAAAATTLECTYSGLRIAGARDGYWAGAEDGEVIKAVRASGARLLFVAMPSPRKEHWVARHRTELGVNLVMGVGGSFDVVAGVTKRAPLWMQRSGLEWLFRFAQEPQRMWKRYLVGNARFMGIIARQLWQRRSELQRSSPGETSSPSIGAAVGEGRSRRRFASPKGQ